MSYTHQSRRASRHPAGESKKPLLRVDFDRRLKLEFHGSKEQNSDFIQELMREAFVENGLTSVPQINRVSDLR